MKVPLWTRGLAPVMVGAVPRHSECPLFRIGDCSRIRDLLCTKWILVYPCWREEPFKQHCLLTCLLNFFSINRSKLEEEC